jgi:hypothetical protein
MAASSPRREADMAHRVVGGEGVVAALWEERDPTAVRLQHGREVAPGLLVGATVVLVASRP